MDYREQSVALTKIVLNRFPQIMDDLGCIVVDCIYVHAKGTFCCLALADSWITGNRQPTPEQIATLRDLFGVGVGDTVTPADNEPMWWITRDSQHWRYRHKRDSLKQYRPWDVEPKPNPADF